MKIRDPMSLRHPVFKVGYLGCSILVHLGSSIAMILSHINFIQTHALSLSLSLSLSLFISHAHTHTQGQASVKKHVRRKNSRQPYKGGRRRNLTHRKPLWPLCAGLLCLVLLSAKKYMASKRDKIWGDYD